MPVIALTTAKGSPGATTAALALTLTWPGRCVLAECDPAGGSVLAGYLAGALPADRGIRELAVAELRGEDLRQAWWGQLVDLHAPHRERLLLPGITDPVQSGTLRPVWDRLAGFFGELAGADGYTVFADCGRLAAPNPPWPVLCAADLVLMVLRPTLPDMSAALPAIRTLRSQLADHGAALALLLTSPGDQSSGTVARHLRTPVIATLPDDPRTARVLSHGGTVKAHSALLRAATGAYRRLTRHIATRQEDAPPHPVTIDDGGGPVAATHGQEATP